MPAGVLHGHAGLSRIVAFIVTRFLDMENFEGSAFVLGCIGTVCWAVCFWWMHRSSSRQNAMLEELREVTARIEKLSQAEHDLIRDVHPQVSEIKEHVQDVRDVVSPEKS
jgi:uncharacterized Fe-S cluster-containing radical SAM superfamily protein